MSPYFRTLEQAKVECDNSKRELARSLTHYHQGSVTADELERARKLHNNATLRLTAAYLGHLI